MLLFGDGKCDGACSGFGGSLELVVVQGLHEHDENRERENDGHHPDPKPKLRAGDKAGARRP